MPPAQHPARRQGAALAQSSAARGTTRQRPAGRQDTFARRPALDYQTRERAVLLLPSLQALTPAVQSLGFAADAANIKAGVLSLSAVEIPVRRPAAKNAKGRMARPAADLGRRMMMTRGRLRRPVCCGPDRAPVALRPRSPMSSNHGPLIQLWSNYRSVIRSTQVQTHTLSGSTSNRSQTNRVLVESTLLIWTTYRCARARHFDRRVSAEDKHDDKDVPGRGKSDDMDVYPGHTCGCCCCAPLLLLRHPRAPPPPPGDKIPPSLRLAGTNPGAAGSATPASAPATQE